MKKISLNSQLEEKIYDLKVDDFGVLSKIITYFPLHHFEKQEILRSLGETTENSIKFKSIFSDEISDKEWNNSKKQIRKKFQDELVDID